MRYVADNDRIQGSHAAMLAVPLALLFAVVSCNKVEKLKVEKGRTTTGPALQQTFPSPEDAGGALLEAAKAGDQSALLAIFGRDGKEVLFTGDAAADKDNLQEFVAAYNQMHRWGKIKAGGEVLYVGADNYAFPIPLGQNSSGRWSFDTAAGKDEILARRIGKGERTAIAACGALAAAEHQYFQEAHPGDSVKQYARKFRSDPGTQNGLYWPVAQRQAPSPLGLLGDFGKELGAGDGPKEFNGYYYRILTKQGDKANSGASEYTVNGRLTRGFAILAYPAEYRNSGIMSFIVGSDGIVYQKDLGEHTADVAAALVDYNPGDGWRRVTQSESSAE
jgi:Protein of unknown function (DUF2950)